MGALTQWQIDNTVPGMAHFAMPGYQVDGYTCGTCRHADHLVSVFEKVRCLKAMKGRASPRGKTKLVDGDQAGCKYWRKIERGTR